MKATGIVRKIDELGRIVLPIEIRKTFGIEIKDPLEIYVDGNSIILKKYEPALGIQTDIERMIKSLADSQKYMSKEGFNATQKAIASLQEIQGLSEKGENNHGIRD